MKKNINDRIILERDTSLLKERSRPNKRLINSEIKKSSKKLSDSINKSKSKSSINENQLDNNINSNNDKNNLDNKNHNEDTENNINENNSKKIIKKINTKTKEQQNAFTQVDFWKEMVEAEIKKTILQ